MDDSSVVLGVVEYNWEEDLILEYLSLINRIVDSVDGNVENELWANGAKDPDGVRWEHSLNLWFWCRLGSEAL